MKWLYRIFRLFVCPHKYAVIQKVGVFSNDRDTLPFGAKFIVQCKRCGKIKTHRV